MSLSGLWIKGFGLQDFGVCKDFLMLCLGFRKPPSGFTLHVQPAVTQSNKDFVQSTETVRFTQPEFVTKGAKSLQELRWDHLGMWEGGSLREAEMGLAQVM